MKERISDERLTIILSFAIAFIFVIGVIFLIAIVSILDIKAESSAGQEKLLHTLEILASVWIGAMAQGLWRQRGLPVSYQNDKSLLQNPPGLYEEK